jgi:hypothetical protein
VPWLTSVILQGLHTDVSSIPFLEIAHNNSSSCHVTLHGDPSLKISLKCCKSFLNERLYQLWYLGYQQLGTRIHHRCPSSQIVRAISPHSLAEIRSLRQTLFQVNLREPFCGTFHKMLDHDWKDRRMANEVMVMFGRRKQPRPCFGEFPCWHAPCWHAPLDANPPPLIHPAIDSAR